MRSKRDEGMFLQLGTECERARFDIRMGCLYWLIRETIHFYSLFVDNSENSNSDSSILKLLTSVNPSETRRDNESSLHRFLMPSHLSLIVFAIIAYCSPNTQTYPVHFASSRIASRFIEFIEPESVMYPPSFPILSLFSLFRTNIGGFASKTLFLFSLSLSLFKLYQGQMFSNDLRVGSCDTWEETTGDSEEGIVG